VERAQRRQHLAQQPDDGTGIGTLPGLLHRPEDRGEALASREFRDQRELRARL
jgi:hypothetical protein